MIISSSYRNYGMGSGGRVTIRYHHSFAGQIAMANREVRPKMKIMAEQITRKVKADYLNQAGNPTSGNQSSLPVGGRSGALRAGVRTQSVRPGGVNQPFGWNITVDAPYAAFVHEGSSRGNSNRRPYIQEAVRDVMRQYGFSL